jgi:hypothetical protein
MKDNFTTTVLMLAIVLLSTALIMLGKAWSKEHTEAIKHHVAYYDSETGDFKFKTIEIKRKTNERNSY